MIDENFRLKPWEFNNGVKAKNRVVVPAMASETADNAGYASDSTPSREGTDIEIRQNKYLNNIIDQDNRPIKQLCRATFGFKRFRTATITIGGFESIRRIRKRQVRAEGDTSAGIFYSMAA